MDLKLYHAASIDKDLKAYATLKATVHVPMENMGKKTVLHVESMHGCKEKVGYILKNFGDKEILVAVDSNQETALHLAAYFKHSNVVGLLISEAKRLFSSDDDPDISFKAFLRKTNGKNNTALHLAVINQNVDVVKLLVEADGNYVHLQNSKGESPIYIAASRGYSNLVKLLCEKCKYPTFDGPQGKTALHAVIKRLHQANKEDCDVVKVLLDKAEGMFATENKKYKEFVIQADNSKDGDTALHLAVRGNHLAVVKLILKVKGPHIAKTNRELKTSLYLAAEKGYKDIVEALLCGGCKFENILGPRDQTILHAAVIGRDPGCVRLILEKEKRLVTYGDVDGWTPLHYAAYNKFDSIIDLIVDTQIKACYQSVYGDKTIHGQKTVLTGLLLTCCIFKTML